MNTLIENASEALRQIALNQEAKNYILENKTIYHILRKAADRYIGGETLDEAASKLKQYLSSGYKTSVEYMGENTSTSTLAELATEEFLKIADLITSQSLKTSIALDLSHIGLTVSRELALENLTKLCNRAQISNIEVMASAENVKLTDDVLRVYTELAPKYKNLGITLQAYLYRTKDDFQEILKYPGRIRIVKGAFEAPESMIMRRSPELNTAFLGYIDRLLSTRHKCSIATHDDLIQDQSEKLIELHSPLNEDYEFESLYGIQAQRLARLKNNGHPAKVYFVYGSEWFLYLFNRLAEEPSNVYQAISDLVK
ncbi:proline dehydrogenase family protein [Desertivirga brevis]|uniref:proline dehydrogenase family protein n=1 Tax=Desertivirga brevis TaxID=2810310 RepID=UPI001A963D6E|nr:proline dehydrogenase family protein [Pedobacter sp. SYSU D00873]